MCALLQHVLEFDQSLSVCVRVLSKQKKNEYWSFICIHWLLVWYAFDRCYLCTHNGGGIGIQLQTSPSSNEINIHIAVVI